MSKSIYLSPSMQEKNLGAGVYGTEEYRMNRLADVVEPLLKAAGLIVYRNRPEMMLKQMVDDSNSNNPSIHFALHTNAGGARGCEVYAYSPGGEGEKLARAVYKRIEALTPVADRGVKFSQSFYELKNTKAPAALIEVDFHDDPVGAAWIIENMILIGQEIAVGILEYFGIKPAVVTPTLGTLIIGPATATVEQAQAWAMLNNAPREFINLAPVMWDVAYYQSLVDPVVAYVQFAHETGFLYRDGKSMAGIDASYHNPCGLKTTTGGGDTVASAHTKFKDWKEGFTAQLDHLSLYAGAPGYPREGTPDPRHFPFIRGTATTVEALSGKWAPSATYGTHLVGWIKALQAIKVVSAVSDDVKRLQNRIFQLERDLEQSNGRAVVSERIADAEKLKYEKYENVFKAMKNLLGGV